MFSVQYHVGFVIETMKTTSKSQIGESNILIFHIIVDGSLSDTAVSSMDPLLQNRGMGPGGQLRQGGQKGNNNAGPAGPGQGGMGKKSNSTSQLSAAGNIKSVQKSHEKEA